MFIQNIDFNKLVNAGTFISPTHTLRVRPTHVVCGHTERGVSGRRRDHSMGGLRPPRIEKFPKKDKTKKKGANGLRIKTKNGSPLRAFVLF